MFIFCNFFQDQPQTKLGPFRRTLNALRFRLTKRNRTKPPDWFLKKYTSGLDSRQAGVPSASNATESLFNRLSVDPSLPSHYRVSNFY